MKLNRTYWLGMMCTAALMAQPALAGDKSIKNTTFVDGSRRRSCLFRERHGL
jgi:hypothetical protein